MIQSTKTAANAIFAQQQRVDVIASNLANVNTVGYKSSRVDFKEALYQTILRPVQPQDDLNLRQGAGVILGNTVKSFRQGAMMSTGMSTDFHLEGKGFFALENSNGDIVFTRDGNFKVSAEPNGNFLVANDGAYVLDVNGNRVQIQGTGADLKVNGEGYLIDAANVPYGQLARFTFMNPSGLSAIGANRFAATDASGGPTADNTTLVKQGYLENSNIEMATEMTRLMRAQRALSLASRALTTADNMDGAAINLR